MKLFIKLFAAFVVLLILGAIILVSVVDPNDYKEQIQTQVKNNTGRDLLINGDISWTFYPSLGFSSGEIQLSNPQGFNRDNLLKIDNAAIAIDVLPLMKGEIKIGDLTLNGLVINVILNEDGSSNLEFKTADTATISEPVETTATEESSSQDQGEGFFALDKIEVAGVNINNTIIEIQDLKAASTTTANIEKIQLGRFSLGESTDLTVLTEVVIDKMNAKIDLQAKLIVAKDFSSIQLNEFQLKTLLTGEDLPNGEVTTSVNADIVYDLNSNLANIDKLVLLVDQIELKGQLSVQSATTTKIRFDLQGNEWDLNPYLTSTDSAENGEAPASTKPATSPAGSEPVETEPDLSALNGLDVQGTFGIAGIKVDKMKIGKIDSTIIVKNGKAELKPLTAKLYQGMLTLNSSVEDAKGSNKYQVSSKLNGVQIRPLLTDAAEIDILSGTTEFNFDGAGQGLTSTKIKSGLTGKGNFKLLDGELYGVNIPQELRALKAKLSGKKAPTEANIKKTDFASLTGNFTIKKGQVDNKKLLMASPVMRLDGSGIANILTESLKYNLSVTPLSKKGEETDLKDLNGVTIPFVISGTFTQPKFALDTDGALKAKLEAEQKRLEKKLKDKTDAEIKKESDKLEKKLKGKLDKLFG
ncbi:MAG: AsmA family protein [Psychromonas sp.]